MSSSLAATRSTRSEPRIPAMVPVEMIPFPRLSEEDRPRVVFTRDRSPSGLCVGSDREHERGALMRVRVLEPDGRLRSPRLARVVWCAPREDGDHWMGLELITARARRAAVEDRGSG